MNQVSADTYRLINEVFILGDDIDRRILARYSLTVRQYHLLNWLAKRKQASLTELANLLLCDKSNVTGIVRRLKAAALIEELPKSDRRFTTVQMTAAGREVHRDATLLLEESVKLRFEGVDQPTHAALQQLLAALHGQLRGYLNHGHLSESSEPANINT